MNLERAYQFMDEMISQGYTPKPCPKWYKTLFELYHGADPTRCCQLACTMVDFDTDMGIDRWQGGDLYVEALQVKAARWGSVSVYIWGAWCVFMASRKDVRTQLNRLEAQLNRLEDKLDRGLRG